MQSTANIFNFSGCCWLTPSPHHTTTANFTPRRTTADNQLGCLSPQTHYAAHSVVLSGRLTCCSASTATARLASTRRHTPIFKRFISISLYFSTISLHCFGLFVLRPQLAGWLAGLLVCCLPRTYFHTHTYANARCWLALQLFRRTRNSLPLVRTRSAASHYARSLCRSAP